MEAFAQACSFAKASVHAGGPRRREPRNRLGPDGHHDYGQAKSEETGTTLQTVDCKLWTMKYSLLRDFTAG
jgi:hypothetical protein